MIEKEKLKKILLNKELRKKLNITDDQLKKLLRDYYQKNLQDNSKKIEKSPYEIFDGGLGI